MSADRGSLNFAWCRQLIAGFAAAGVRQAVISPGSRSTPLALALLRQGGMDCRVILDERSAAFFALGLAKASGQPAIVVATSGSAPANWLPAVVEASRAAVPLILLSADRPPELHQCGANQTIDQVDLFGHQVRARHALAPPEAGFDPAWLQRLAAQVVDQACWPLPGPVHVNQPLREPLLPGAEVPAPGPGPAPRRDRPPSRPAPETVAALAARLSGRPGAIVCGELPVRPDLAPAVTALAGKLACPILAEPLSGLRFGPHDRSRICCRYQGWLGHAAFGAAQRPDWVLRLGNFPVTRALQAFVAAPQATDHILVDPLPRWQDPANVVDRMVAADPAAVCAALNGQALAGAPPAWMAAFAAAEAAVAARPPPAAGEGGHLQAVLGALPDRCPVFVGNSLLIRELDAFSGAGARTIEFFANRGASGIDGNVSTALGIAAERGRVVALLGDLTCQHDLGGLAAAAGLDALIVVFNNGGGAIFAHLPQAGLPEFEQAWLAPQRIDFAAAARTFGLAYRVAATPDATASAVAAALETGGPSLLEIRLDRLAGLAERQAWALAMADLDLGRS